MFRKVAMAELRRRILSIVQTQPIHGSHGVSVVDVDGTTVVLIGEVHENPNGCPDSPVDVVRDLVWEPFHQNDDVLLLVEGFPLDLRSTPRAMQTSINLQYPRAATFDRCLDGAQFRCMYDATAGALDILRYGKARMHMQTLSDPNPMWRRLNDRFQLVDVRPDLGMHSPFSSAEEQRRTTDFILPSLQNIHLLHRFLVPIPKGPWDRAFAQNVLSPFVQQVDSLRNQPSWPAYRDLFVQVPDIVATNRILGTRHKLVIVYAGDDHRRGILRMLRGMAPAVRMQELALSVNEADNGSCSRPFSLVRLFHREIFR